MSNATTTPGRARNRLAFLDVARKKVGRHCDGGGLYLQVTSVTARSWLFVYRIKGRQRQLGLGSARFVTLGRSPPDYRNSMPGLVLHTSY
jgi:hypothetical protein